MTRVFRARAVALAGFLCAIFMLGCGGPKMVKVHGTVTQDGNSIKFPDKAKAPFTITFAPTESTGQTYPAKFDREQSTYQVTVPAGNYKVGIIAPDVKVNSPMDKSKTYEVTGDQEI